MKADSLHYEAVRIANTETGTRRPLLRAEVNRLRRRLVMTLEMIREVEAEREQALQKQDDTASRTIQALRQLRGRCGGCALADFRHARETNMPGCCLADNAARAKRAG